MSILSKNHLLLPGDKVKDRTFQLLVAAFTVDTQAAGTVVLRA